MICGRARPMSRQASVAYIKAESQPPARDRRLRTSGPSRLRPEYCTAASRP